MRVEFYLNGAPVSLEVEPNETLLDTLRNRLNITSVKRGCEEGECGSCTVLLDGKPITSCLVLTVQVQGRNVTTLEGAALDGLFATVQKAFVESFALQCGFCTSGFVLTTGALLRENPEPSDDQIKTALEGNLCRCTGYVPILNAVKKASYMITKRKTNGR